MTTRPKIEAWPVVVRLSEEIDLHNARDVRNQITAAALRPGVTIVIAGMTATTFCDTMGSSALVQAHKRAACNGTEVRLLSPRPPVMRVLELLGLDRVLAIYGSIEDAMMP